jgi:hypothetical protein
MIILTFFLRNVVDMLEFIEGWSDPHIGHLLASLGVGSDLDLLRY